MKNARLALTGVSRIQLLAEESTNADPWGPETRTMATLSEAAFDREEYERIVQVLHDRLDPNSKRHWKQVLKTLTVLEYLLTHGPGSLSKDFQADASCIEELCQFNLIDHQGIDRGISIRNKADRVLELLSKADLWKKERSRAQKISHGIQGFGGSIERTNATTESEQSHQAKSVVSGPMLAEGGLLVANETSQYAKLKVDSPTEWKAFEKCTTIPSYLGYDDVSSPCSDKLISRSVEHKERVYSSYKKSLSSPSHFRGASPVIWQAIPVETINESPLESYTSEVKQGTGDLILLQATHDADKETTPFDEMLDLKFRDVPQLNEVVPPRHTSMRRLFEFHRPGVHHSKQNSHLHEKEHAKEEKVVVHEEKIVAEPAQNPPENVMSSAIPGKPPLLPPPPTPKFRTRIKNHFQHSNLLD